MAATSPKKAKAIAQTGTRQPILLSIQKPPPKPAPIKTINCAAILVDRAKSIDALSFDLGLFTDYLVLSLFSSFASAKGLSCIEQ